MKSRKMVGLGMFILMVVLSGNASAAVLDGLAAGYTFDEAQDVTTAQDSSGNNNDLYRWGTTSISGKVGGAYVFDGAGEACTIFNGAGTATGIPIGDNSYSIALWVKPDQLYGDMIGWGTWATGLGVNAFKLQKGETWNGGDGLANYWWGSDLEGIYPGGIADGNWHLVAASYDAVSGTRAIWLDNVQLVSFAEGNALATTTADTLVIGKNLGGSDPFGGAMDEVGIWNRALTTGDMAELWNDGAGMSLAVPEPTTMMLLGLGGLGLLRRNRK